MDYYGLGFKAKKKDDYFFDHDIITNENPYEIMYTVIKVAKEFYLNKINEIIEANKKFNFEINATDFIKGFVFSFSGNKEKNHQRLKLYSRYFNNLGIKTEYENIENYYYLKIKDVV
jgi:hypothetical protein